MGGLGPLPGLALRLTQRQSDLGKAICWGRTAGSNTDPSKSQLEEP